MPNQYDQRASARRQALLALLSGTVAEPAAGLAGLYGLVTGGAAKGAHNVEATRNALTYRPRDASALEAVGRAVEPVAGRLQKLRDYLGDKTMAHTGSPALATAGYMVPDTLLTLLGARGMGVKGPKLAQMVQATRELPSMGSPVSQIGAIRAYHGSPHDFDRFSMANIGTGGGAQAYGHGLYFAGNKGVAANYRERLTTRDFINKARDAYDEFDDPESAIAELKSQGLNEDQMALVDALQADGWLGFDYPHQAIQAALRRDPGFEYSPETIAALNRQGRLYNVELAPDEADLLDWDAPIRDQPHIVEAVQKAHPGYMSGGLPNAQVKAADAYYALAEQLGSEAAASEHLRSLGIPGIRYLDGGSRAAGDGSRNYVMFDDSLVKIKGKE